MISFEKAFCQSFDPLRTTTTKVQGDYKIVSCLHNRHFCFTTTESEAGKFFIYSFELSNLKEKKYLLNNFNSNLTIRSIAIVNDTLILANKDSIYIFSKRLNSFHLLGAIPTIRGYDLLLNCGNLIFLNRIYNYHPLDASNHFGIVRFDYREKVFTDSLAFPYPGIEYSPLVNRWVTSSNKCIFLALTTLNKVLVINQNLKIIDTILTDITMPSCALPSNVSNNPSKSNIMALMSRDTSCHRIEKLITINDSTLLISSIFPKSSKDFRKIQLFQKIDSNWILISSRIYCNIYIDSENISIKTIKPNLTYSLKIESADNFFVYTLNGQYLPKKKTKYKEFKVKSEKFYNKKDPKYRIILYHVNY